MHFSKRKHTFEVEVFCLNEKKELLTSDISNGNYARYRFNLNDNKTDVLIVKSSLSETIKGYEQSSLQKEKCMKNPPFKLQNFYIAYYHLITHFQNNMKEKPKIR